MCDSAELENQLADLSQESLRTKVRDDILMTEYFGLKFKFYNCILILTFNSVSIKYLNRFRFYCLSNITQENIG